MSFDYALPSGWKWSSLEKVVLSEKNAIADGPFGSNLKSSDYVESGVPVLQGKNITNNIFQWKDVRYISEAKAEELKRSQVKVGDLLMIKIGSIGYSALIDCLHGFECAVIPANMAKLSLDETVIYPKYLRFWLTSIDAVRGLQGMASKTAQPAISLAKIKPFPVPLPPLETQKQIAAVLEKADQLRKDCQQMEQELNSLAQSVFIDMFGDPLTNPKGWERTNLPAHGSFKNGLNFSKDDSGVSLKYLGVGDFKSLSSIRGLDNLGFVDVNSLPADDYLLKNGDLVFVRSNGNKALVGRCISIYPDDVPVTFSGFCIRYRVESDSMEPEWLNYMLRTASMKQAMLEGGQGANIQNINQKILSLLEIPLPPIDKQRLFCKTIESYRESLFQLNEYSKELNDLFNSLMQKAFKGELNL